MAWEEQGKQVVENAEHLQLHQQVKKGNKNLATGTVVKIEPGRGQILEGKTKIIDCYQPWF